jgi:FtsZ-interacting cell division protein ZipA
MSELQIALIAIGALIILAVLVINWRQERRFHSQVEKSFLPLQSDALLDDSDINEPKLSQPRKFNEPKFDTGDSNGTSAGALDSRATDHFSIDETMVFNKHSQQTKYKDSDRFVELPQDNAAETMMKEKESIDVTYNKLINSKLDRLSTHISESDNKQALAKEGVDKQNGDFKAVFDEALSSKTQTTASLPASEDIQAQLESSVTLPEMLHGQMDLTALLYLSNETPVSALNNALTALFDNFDKPVFVHVLDSNKKWFLLKDMQSNQDALNRLISKVACSIQLADRGGAIERNTLNRFQLAVETLGLDINGHVEWQNAGDALSAANSLDLFCIEVDKTIGFHLVHGDSGAFTGTKLRGLAESQGLVLNSDGTFKYFDQSSDGLNASKQRLVEPQLHPSFVMFNRDDHPFSPEMLRSSVVKGITFQLDIPHVKHSSETFNQMIQVARQMEIGLNALLVDDKNKALGDIQVEKIRQQLKVLQAMMLVRGIIPGSDSAHRLFS